MGAMLKKVMILGAGPEQRPMYAAAKSMGLHITGVDMNCSANCKDLADSFLNISSRAHESLRCTLGSDCPDAVISPASDVGIVTAYRLGNYYGLNSRLSFHAFKSSTDKNYFNNLIINHGIKAPKNFKALSAQNLKQIVEEIGYPLIVKPSDAAGGKGITYVDDEKCLEEAFCKAMAFSFNQEVVIEEFINGVHYSAELLRYNSKTVFAAVSLKTSTGPPSFLNMQHLIPAPLPDYIDSEVRKTLDLLCAICEIDNGPVNFDLIINGEGLYIIEMSARVSGNGMSVLIKESYGVDNCVMDLQVATGQPLTELKKAEFRAYSALRTIIADYDGVFDGISGFDEVKRHPAFKDVNLFVKAGDAVHKFTHEGHKLGYVILAHSDLEMLKDGILLVENTFKVKILT